MNTTELNEKLSGRYKDFDISVITYPKHTGNNFNYRELNENSEEILERIEINIKNEKEGHSIESLSGLGISKVDNFDESDFEKICQEIKVSIG